MDEWIVAGRYRVESLIGIGGTAHVYKAVRVDTGETVAIKMLRPELSQDASFIRQFRKEAQIAIRYHHRNIVETLEVGDEDGGLYIVMEYIQGNTLKDIIKTQGPLSHAVAVDYAVQIAEALAYAHSHQLVHRDIKPQNMLIDGRGVLKVSDFGIARVASVSTMTMTGKNVMGSVHYLSPEQAQGGYVDTRSDLYSLGVVLYEMVTGRVPFDGDTAVSVAIKHIQDRVIPPRRIRENIPPSLEKVILKAMQKRPAQRYQYAAEMINDLVRTLEEPDGDFVKLASGAARMPSVSAAVNEGEQKPLVYLGTGKKQGKLRRKLPRRVIWRRVLIVFLLLCFAALGVLGVRWLQLRSQAAYQASLITEPLPRFIQMEETEAVTLLRDMGLEALIQTAYSDEYPAGTVISQLPEPDVRMQQGETVTLTVSLGEELLPIPNVEGLSLDEARTEIEAAGFQVGAVTVQSSDAPRDTVLAQSPLPAEEAVLKRGSLIDLWIARDAEGGSQATMPPVVGMGEQAALDYLESLGLTATIAGEEPSEIYAMGLVARQSPEVDSPIDADTEITLWISSGILQQWTYEYAARLEVEENDTQVVIWFDENGPDAAKIYDETLGQGRYGPIQLTAVGTQGGNKTITIYYNGVLHSSETLSPKEEES